MISRGDFLIKESAHAMELKTKILPIRERARVMDDWLKERLDTVLPRVMERCGVDAWVVACNEYNEDPVLDSLTPYAFMSARRFTILLFILKDGKIKRYNITRPNVGLDGFYEACWINQKGSTWCEDPSKAETQYECLVRMLKENDVSKIGLNYSDQVPFSDGITHSIYTDLMANMDEDLRSKVVSAENVCTGWLETRTEREMEAYTGIVQIIHAIIDEAFSSRVIIPGVTTNTDVKYFMMQTVIDLGLEYWFDYEVSVIRSGIGRIDGETVIRQGDMLHCDVGIRYLGLCTDTQEFAYVLKHGEDDAPDYLKKLLADTDRFRMITVSNFKEGRSGNQVLAMSLEQARAEGLEPCLYCHAVGYHGHAAGAVIGLTDQQGGVLTRRGDYPIYNDTVHSIELNCGFTVEEWGGVHFTVGLETDAVFTNDQIYFLAGRQESFHLIK